MKYNIKIFFLLLTILSCSTANEDLFTFEVNVTNITYEGVSLSWDKPKGLENVVYKVIVNNRIIAEYYNKTELKIEKIFKENTTYFGFIHALANNGKETFTNFSFTTERNPISRKHLIFTKQSEIDEFYYSSVGSITISGKEINNLNGLSSLELVETFIKIESTLLKSLKGLDNLSETLDYPHFPKVELHFNSQLLDISDLKNFIPKVRIFSLVSSPIKNLDFITFNEGKNPSIALNNIQINNLKNLSNLKSMSSLWLDNLPNIKSLDDLSNLEEIKKVLSIRGMPELTSLVGLNKLKTFRGLLQIENNIGLTTLNGFNSSFDAKKFSHFYITNNQNLIDYCDFKDFLVKFNATIDRNGFNPSLLDLENGLCSP